MPSELKKYFRMTNQDCKAGETKGDRNSWKGLIRGGKGLEGQSIVFVTKITLHELCRRNKKVYKKCKGIVNQTSMSNELVLKEYTFKGQCFI